MQRRGYRRGKYDINTGIDDGIVTYKTQLLQFEIIISVIQQLSVNEGLQKTRRSYCKMDDLVHTL